MNEVATAARAKAALDEVREVRSGLAKRTVCPRGRHELVGVLAGLYVMLQGGPLWWSLVYLAGFFAVALAIVVRARRRNGFWINGWRRGRTRRVTVPFMIVWSAVLMATIWAAKDAHLAWAPFVGGLTATGVVIAAGYAWERVYRREMVRDA